MNELKEALADVKVEGTDPFAQFETETQPESLPEEQPEAEPVVEEPAAATEENIPFHKHPRWIERENELRILRERDEERARELEEIRSLTSKSQESTNVPEWFKTLYGDNEVAWQQYSEHERERTEEIERRVLERQEREKIEKAQEAERWDKWVDAQLDTLEAEGHQFDRNKLMKTMLEFKPTDENNNFDFRAGLKIYQALERPEPNVKSEARKQLADTATASSNKGEAPRKTYMTQADLRNKSWSNLLD